MKLGPRPEPCDDGVMRNVRYLNRLPGSQARRGVRWLHPSGNDSSGDRRRTESVRVAVSAPCSDRALRSVVEMALDAGWDAAGLISVGTGDVPHSACASSPLVGRLDALQVTFGQGPAVDSLRETGRAAVVSRDLDVDSRWSPWRPAAIAAGVRTVISLRLFTDRTLGALNLYSGQPHGDDDGVLAEADAIAAQASAVLAHTASEERLWQAIDGLSTVGQAQPILMQRYGVTAAGARAVLRSYAEHQDPEAADLARRITSTRQE